MPPKTPKTPANPVTGTATPGRVARLEEKSELQDLNKRLEFYILKQREKDASAGSIQRNIIENKEYYEAEIAKMKTLHESQVTIFRKQRDDKDSDIERLGQENKRQTNMIKQYTAQMAVDQLRLSDLEDRINSTASDLANARVEASAAQEEAKKAAFKIKQLESQIKVLDNNLKNSDNSAANAARELAALQSNSKNHNEDYATLTDKCKKESMRAAQLEAELSKTRGSIEDELRKIFGGQLKDILKERQAQYEEDKAEGLNNLKELYEGQLAVVNAKCDKLQLNLQESHARTTEVAGQMVASSSCSTGFESIISGWESRVETLQSQLATQRSTADDKLASVVRQHAKQVASLEADIKELESQLGSNSSQSAQLSKAEEEAAFHRKEVATLRTVISDQKKQLSVTASQVTKMKAMESQIDFLTEQTSNLKAEKNKCEAEYISLMDVKVALDMEIRAYRLLIENEEHRLEPQAAAISFETDIKHVEEAEEEGEEEQVPISSRKRGRTSVAVTPAPKAKRSRQGTAKKAASTPQSAKSPQQQQLEIVMEPEVSVSPTFVISGMDAKKHVQVTNSTKQSQSMDGWSLKVQSSKKSFMFPDAAAVKPGKTVTVWFGNGKKPKDAIDWTEGNQFQSSDKLYLMAPDGVGHSSVDFSE